MIAIVLILEKNLELMHGLLAWDIRQHEEELQDQEEPLSKAK